jgi:hypothetical protein
MKRSFAGRALLALLAAGLSAEAHAARELVMFTPEEFGNAPFCCSGCDDLPNTVQDGQHFDAGFGSYDVVQQWQDQAVDGRDFTDPAVFAVGADSTSPSGTDWADVIFYSGHGSRTCSQFAGHWSQIVMGDNNAGEACSPKTAWASGSNGHMRFGGTTANRDANALVTFSCQSAHLCVWENGGYSPMDQGQFNILNGFHGIVWEVSGYQDDLEDYANDAEWNDVGDAWLDRMYRWHKSGENNCPVAIVWGANEGEVDDFYDNAGWYDFHDTGAHAISGFFYLDGCNPKEGDKL